MTLTAFCLLCLMALVITGAYSGSQVIDQRLGRNGANKAHRLMLSLGMGVATGLFLAVLYWMLSRFGGGQ